MPADPSARENVSAREFTQIGVIPWLNALSCSWELWEIIRERPLLRTEKGLEILGLAPTRT